MEPYKGDENLRDYYITPLWLENMVRRVRDWDEGTILEQIRLFKYTIPEYPEPVIILESELHRRRLNDLKKESRKMSEIELKNNLKKLEPDSDEAEVIRTELEIRTTTK